MRETLTGFRWYVFTQPAFPGGTHKVALLIEIDVRCPSCNEPSTRTPDNPFAMSTFTPKRIANPAGMINHIVDPYCNVKYHPAKQEACPHCGSVFVLPVRSQNLLRERSLSWFTTDVANHLVGASGAYLWEHAGYEGAVLQEWVRSSPIDPPILAMAWPDYPGP